MKKCFLFNLFSILTSVVLVHSTTGKQLQEIESPLLRLIRHKESNSHTVILIVPLNTDMKSSEALETHLRGRVLQQYCGGGKVGNGVCADRTCCSRFGWCGTSVEHCTGGTCGNGKVGNGVCANKMCCSQYGWCGITSNHCGGSSGGISTKLLTLADLQKAMDMYNSLQKTAAPATQALVDKINDITRNYSLYRRIAFVAHTIWESGGYVYTVEQDKAKYGSYQECDWDLKTNNPATNGKQFYGRGYMQLSWCANYKAYGKFKMINGDPDYFYNNPDLVATTYAWDSAVWFFEAVVKDDSGSFGVTTKNINGDLECNPSANTSDSTAKKRYKIFEALANKMGLTGFSESGCYN